MTTHADYFRFNRTYGVNAYSKGEVFVAQLEYIIGRDAIERTMLRYFDEWAFKHPEPEDFIRIAERESGITLDWYLNLWTQTTRTIDYSVHSLENTDKGVRLSIKNNGNLPMPVEFRVITKQGKTLNFYIPLVNMWGSKPSNYKELPAWAWTTPIYGIELQGLKQDQIESIEIDPGYWTADVDRDNNLYPFSKKKKKGLFKRLFGKS